MSNTPYERIVSMTADLLEDPKYNAIAVRVNRYGDGKQYGVQVFGREPNDNSCWVHRTVDLFSAKDAKDLMVALDRYWPEGIGYWRYSELKAEDPQAAQFIHDFVIPFEWKTRDFKTDEELDELLLINRRMEPEDLEDVMARAHTIAESTKEG